MLGRAMARRHHSDAAVPTARGRGWPDMLGGVAALAAVLGAATLRAALQTNSDVAWLLTVGEKVLDGQRLYVDVIETNPPASVLVYVPAIALGRLLGIAPERMLDAQIFFGVLLSLALTWLLLVPVGTVRGGSWPWLLAASAGIVLLLPSYNFGQREHIALLCILPALAATAARARGLPPRRSLAVAAGLGLGLTVSIKPHFALAALLPELFLLTRLRSLRPPFRAENLVAAAVAAAYASALVAFFPAYLTNMLPLLRDVFLPVHYGLELLTAPATMFWAATGLWLLLASQEVRRDPLVLVAFLASAGFLGAFLIQGKGWSYQAYPSVALAFFALAVAISKDPSLPIRGGSTARLALRTACALALAALSYQCAVWLGGGRDFAGLASAVADLKPRPKLIAVSADLSIGHPLVRHLGGRWVARVCSQWVTEGALLRQRQDLGEPIRSRLDGHIAKDLDRLAEDIRTGRPDIVLIHLDWLDWRKRMTTGRLGEVFSPYQHVRTVGDVEIWSPVDRPPD
jgi:hypothetical protein